MKLLFKKSFIVLSMLFMLLTLSACAEKSAQPTQAPVATSTPIPTEAPDSTEPAPDVPTPVPAELTSAPTSTPAEMIPVTPEVTHGAVKIAPEDFIKDAKYKTEGSSFYANDGTYYYTIDKHRVYKIGLYDESDKTEVTIDYPILPEYVDGYYENRSGEACIIIYGKCADRNYYDIAYNIEKKTVDMLISRDSPFVLVNNNRIPILYGFDSLFYSNVLYPNDNPVAFVFSSTKVIELIPMDKNHVLVTHFMHHISDNEGDMMGRRRYDGRYRMGSRHLFIWSLRSHRRKVCCYYNP